MTPLPILLALLAVAGMVYQLAAAVLVRRFMNRPRWQPSQRLPVTVLKPLCGAEPGLAENLRGLLAQDYPLQLVCGLRDGTDPARAVVEALPDERVRLVVDGRIWGTNLKVSNLINMLGEAQHDILVLADSDVSVAPGHLQDVVAALEEHPGVGLVTCLYVGQPVGGLWSGQGALWINHCFLPSALVARALGRLDGCFGATIALRREVLEAAGGLAPLADLLADDHALGALVRQTGLSIALAPRPVTVTVQETGLRALLNHEIRWGRTVACVDRVGYIASVLTQPLPFALLAAMVGGGWWWSLPVMAALLRLAVVRDQERSLRLPRVGAGALLLREAVNFIVWAVACCGRTVHWRGRNYRIRPDGSMESEGNIDEKDAAAQSSVL